MPSHPKKDIATTPVIKKNMVPVPKEIAPVPKEIAAEPLGSAVSIVLIETNGTLKTLKAKEVSLESLYKKCGYRVNDDFLCRHTWSVTLKGLKEVHKVSLWAKKNGKANFENKYDLPPPLDKELFFGTCALVRTSTEGTGASTEGTGTSAVTSKSMLDLTKETWLKIYAHLFGGFEDIGEEDEFSEDELANVDPKLLTADGYLKDDFVVSDKETASGHTSVSASASETDTTDTADEELSACETDTAASACETDTEAEEDAPAPVKKKIVKKTTKVVKKVVAKKGKAAVKEIEEPEEISELEEEVYTFSDEED
jgi:hypothetical protein